MRGYSNSLIKPRCDDIGLFSTRLYILRREFRDTANVIVDSNFKPAWWLPGPHLQTLWSSMVRKPPRPETLRERLELPDGDFVDLECLAGDRKSIVCLFHGLEGSIDSTYVRATMNALGSRSIQCVLMHFRGCSGEPNRKVHSYHSGHTDDIRFLLSTLRQRHPEIHLGAIGFSLGANALLKYQGEEGYASPLDFALAVSPPFLLAAGAKRMESGFSTIYQRHLVNSMKMSLRQKMRAIDNFPISDEELSKLNNFWDFDDRVTARLNGFTGVHDYYEKSSCRQFLPHIRKQTHIIHAIDDPFFDAHMIPGPDELSDKITLELARHGGHVGFVAGSIPGRPTYWLDQRIAEIVCKNLVKRVS